MARSVQRSLSQHTYGLPGDGSTISVNLDTSDGQGGVLASVAGVAAHEMVHAIMLHSTSFAFPGWFIEGTAELIQGADERVAGAIAGGRNAGTIVAAAKSRIQDADYANATARMTRARILQEAASVMLTQANGEGRVVLALLR